MATTTFEFGEVVDSDELFPRLTIPGPIPYDQSTFHVLGTNGRHERADDRYLIVMKVIVATRAITSS